MTHGWRMCNKEDSSQHWQKYSSKSKTNPKNSKRTILEARMIAKSMMQQQQPSEETRKLRTDELREVVQREIKRVFEEESEPIPEDMEQMPETELITRALRSIMSYNEEVRTCVNQQIERQGLGEFVLTMHQDQARKTKETTAPTAAASTSTERGKATNPKSVNAASEPSSVTNSEDETEEKKKERNPKDAG